MKYPNTIQCGDMGVIVANNAIIHFDYDYRFPSYLPGHPGTHFYTEFDPLLTNDQRVMVDIDANIAPDQKLVIAIKYSPFYPDGLRFRLAPMNQRVSDAIYLVYEDVNGTLHNPVCLFSFNDPEAGSSIYREETCEYALIRNTPADPTRYTWHKMVQSVLRVDV